MSLSKCIRLILLLLLPVLVNAQDAVVHAKLDPQTILVGDRARVFIEAEVDASKGKLQWTVFPDTFNTLEIIEKGRIDTVKSGARTIYRQRVQITGFDSGVFKIPAFSFSWIPNNGTSEVLTTAPFNLLVQTVAVDTNKPIKPIKDIIAVSYSPLKDNFEKNKTWYYTGAAIIALIIIAIVCYLIFRMKPVPEPPPPPPAISLQEKYMSLVNTLDNEHLWQHDKVKEYYVQLTDILRTYIEERFRTPAMELTTDELLAKAARIPELQPHYQLLKNILQTADLAKFAKAQPLPQEHVGAMDDTKQFILSTPQVIIDNKPSDA